MKSSSIFFLQKSSISFNKICYTNFLELNSEQILKFSIFLECSEKSYAEFMENLLLKKNSIFMEISISSNFQIYVAQSST